MIKKSFEFIVIEILSQEKSKAHPNEAEKNATKPWNPFQVFCLVASVWWDDRIVHFTVSPFREKIGGIDSLGNTIDLLHRLKCDLLSSMRT
jgi:hypothetical protein